MSDYNPTSRRPIADMFRRPSQGAVSLCVRWGIHPDVISCLSVVASALAAVCFWQSSNVVWLLIPAVGFCYVRLWCNMLDGMVALASKRASLRGEILNEVPDRISDVVIFVGVAHCGMCHVLGGYWVAILAVAVAYIGTFGQALGVGRQFGGMMSKPWRMVALNIGAWITLGLIVFGKNHVTRLGPTVLDWTHLLIVLGCLESIVVRLSRILRKVSTPTPRN